MARIIETDDSGNLLVPHEALGAAKPHVRFQVEPEGNALKLVPVDEGTLLWQRLSPKERAAEFVEWAKGVKPKARHIPDEALRRENLYD